MLRIAIVEDDIRQQELLKEYLKRYFGENEKPAIMVYESGETFLAERGRKPDILFLDIAMAGMSGMETARKIRETDRTMILIFVTELFQYALEGYAVNATDFLIKPVYYPSFCVSVKRAMDLLSERKPGMIRIPFDKTVTMVDISSILYVETEGKKTCVHTGTGNYPCSDTMKTLEEKLEPFGFARCHQAFLVNLRCVESVRKQELSLDGVSIPISRYKKEEFLQKMTRFVGGIL